MIENPLAKKLIEHRLILASGSPRRKKFFEDLGIEFEIRLHPVDEVYPNDLKAAEIAIYLAQLKASVFKDTLKTNEILVTSDTVVWHKEQSLAKANDENEAIEMLTKLSGDWHEVISAVSFTTTEKQKTVSATTKVKFCPLTREEIRFYVSKWKPFDKAGAYGIQDWLGAIGIEAIEGSYNNVVGLPTHIVYKTLTAIVD